MPVRHADLDPISLQLVARDLARYIGPVADIVVKRAARGCSSVTALRRSVAQEIEGAADRARFLAGPPTS
jgi:serine/threonine-protein kinase